MAIRHRKDVFERSLVPPFTIRQAGYTLYALTAAGFMWGFFVGSHMSARLVGRTVLRDDGILPIRTMKPDQVEKFWLAIARPRSGGLS
jgi:hypothetical protein